MGGELSFPSLNRLEANGLEVADRGAHSNRLPNGGSSRLKFVGQVRPSAVIEEHILDHFSTTQEGRHRLQ